MDKKIWSWLEGMELTPTAAPAPAPTPSEAPGAIPPEPAPAEPPVDIRVTNPPPTEDPNQAALGPGPADRPEDSLELLDFERFRDEYIDSSSTGKPDDLLEKLDQLRGIVDLGPRERRFLNDNILILLLMREQEIYDTSRKVHKVESPLDMMAQLSESIDKSQLLREVPIKLPSFFGMKGDIYRKFVAALCGGVQIGSGSLVEDVVVSPTKGQRFLFSTRIYTDFGSVELVPWYLTPGDPELYLKEIERDRLRSGSPEERNVLLKRVVLSSITKLVKSRIFMICVSNPSSGKRVDLALQMDNLLMQGYEKGLITLELTPDEEKQGILPTGELVSLSRVQFIYHPTTEGVEPVVFVESQDGVLMLVADLATIEEVVASVGNGMVHKTDFEGTDEDLDKIQRCIPTIQEMLLKRC